MDRKQILAAAVLALALAFGLVGVAVGVVEPTEIEVMEVPWEPPVVSDPWWQQEARVSRLTMVGIFSTLGLLCFAMILQGIASMVTSQQKEPGNEENALGGPRGFAP